MPDTVLVSGKVVIDAHSVEASARLRILVARLGCCSISSLKLECLKASMTS